MLLSVEATIGSRLLLIRELLLLTVKEVYQLTEIPSTTLRRIEKGELPAKSDYINKLCYLYQVDKIDLYNLEKRLPDWKSLRRKVLLKHRNNEFIVNAINKKPKQNKAIQFRVLKSSFLNNYKTTQNIVDHLVLRYNWNYSYAGVSMALDSLVDRDILEIKNKNSSPLEYRKLRTIPKEEERLIEQLWLYLEEMVPKTTTDLVTPAFEKMAGMLFFLKDGPKKREQIFNSVNYGNLHKNHQKSLKILEDFNLVEKTIKDKPTSSLQTYQLTGKGIDIVNKFMCQP